MTGAQVVAHARGWIGTPYRHQTSLQAAGADCLGLIRGIWRALYGGEPCLVPPYSPSWAEIGAGEPLWAALSHHLLPAGPRLADGQIALFRMQARARAKHLGILTQNTRAFIHACPRAGVCEAPLSEPWARRIVARFDFPALPKPEHPAWQP